ncbi:glycosyltransferase family 2 protein [Flagellimonas algicola]|uniref:Glycosyltransferase family 2 protein n=1 Tax=Flagellimonas algicola TaxID=2583815 RepID=A0ABY2WMY2_9FLAO|nr:glycosyltransferase family 2 protein [Allomuricauda algicola]TMU56341.1 glycosyltransferase family 2 protein [Allomuricauda algicola]
MQNPTVSLFIPFKNTQEYLPACLDSILTQTYSYWEVLAVDDHSEDQSREILEAYAKKDNRIKVYSNSGSGIIPALRTAYTQSSGELVSRMDSDDIMKPNRVEVLAELLGYHGKGHVAVGQVQYFSHRGISDGYARYETWLNALTANGNNYTEIYKECVIPSPCWMLHRDDFELSGAFNPNRYPEDYDLTFRFYENQLKIIPCNDVLHLWRDYDTRTSRTHEHYAQNYFLDIKLHYFLKLDRDPIRPLVVWGAGFKGKSIAKSLVKQGLDFVWLCDNPAKIGKKIYGQELEHFESLKKLKNPQSVVTVANGTAQMEIREFFSTLGQQAKKDYFFFC